MLRVTYCIKNFTFVLLLLKNKLFTAYFSNLYMCTCDNVNIIHLFYVYTTVLVIPTILCNRFSIAIVELG